MMATRAIPQALPARAANTGLLLPACSLWWRELIRFYRQRSRVVGVVLSPLLFWLLLGGGFGSAFRSAGEGHQLSYLQYFFPGSLVMIVLFTSIFTMMSVIEDRREGFLLSVLSAPVSRASIVLSKVMGGATLATLQGVVFLLLAPTIGLRFTVEQVAVMLGIIVMIAFALTALGFAVAWTLDSPQAFHAIINLFLIPLWLLSGAVFPVASASGIIRVLMKANPLTYGMFALQATMFPEHYQSGIAMPLAVLGGFCAAVFTLAMIIAQRRSTLPAA